MVGITGKSGSKQFGDGIFRPLRGQKKHTRAFCHGHALSLSIERLATVAVNQLERVKTEIGQATQRIHPPDKHRFGHAAAEHGQAHGNGDNS
jgi:hypothetical protein